MKEWAPVEVEFYKQKYDSASAGNYDIYVVFVEKGLSLLNKNGRLGFILPHKFFNAQYGMGLRSIIAKGKHLSHVVHFGDQQVFTGASTYTCLTFLDKSGAAQCRFVEAHDLKAWRNEQKALEGEVPAARVNSAEWNFAIGGGATLFDRLTDMPVKLGDVAGIFVGLQTSADTVFLFKDCKRTAGRITRVHSKELHASVDLESALLKPVVRSGSIGRYSAMPTALVLFPYKFVGGTAHLIPEEELKSNFPQTWNYLVANKKLLCEREHGKFRNAGWYQLYPKNLDGWEQPKLMLPYMVTRLSAYYDESNAYFVNVTTGGFGVITDERRGTLKYVTGLVNSTLLAWFMKKVSTPFRGGYYAANKQFLVQLPFRPIDLSSPADKARHDRMVELVERMLELHKKLPAARTPDEKTRVERDIAATDKTIDALVYELYGLADDEIRIVEASSSR